MEIFNIIPLSTKFSILFLVMLPAFAVIYLRFSLYTRLQSINRRVARLLVSGEEEGIQPEIVKRLRLRYQTASQKLEHVNTIALIDSIYQDETIAYGKFTVQFDRIDSITRVLPNLLIAFGLIGTFLGITSNLTNISTIVTGFSHSNPNVGGLVQGLQKPLEDMGVAFSSSLFGLLFGSGLTIVNTIYNTSIAKYQLVSGLEDYLDNIYKPTVEGNSRIDRAIDRMVQQQHEFLLRFHENVGAVLKDTLGEAANKISEEYSRINLIAENIYTNFSNAAGTISTGATTFERAANSLDTKTKHLADALDRFQGGVDTFSIAADRLEQNNIVQNIDRVLAELNTSQQAFTTSTETLQDSLVGIVESNQTAAQLARQVYETWQDSTTQIITASETIGAGAVSFQQSSICLEEQTQTIVDLLPQLKAGIHTFVAAANKVKTNNIIKHLDNLVENLDITQAAFTNSTQTLAADVAEMMSSHQQATQIAERVYQGLELTTNTIQTGANNFERAAQTIQDSSISIDLTLANATNKWQNTQAEFTNSTAILSQAAQNIQPVAAKLEPTIAALDRFGTEIVNLSKNITHLQSPISHLNYV